MGDKEEISDNHVKSEYLRPKNPLTGLESYIDKTT